MADDKQQTSEQVEASTMPDEIAAHAILIEDKLTALVQGYNYETGEFVR